MKTKLAELLKKWRNLIIEKHNKRVGALPETRAKLKAEAAQLNKDIADLESLKDSLSEPDAKAIQIINNLLSASDVSWYVFNGGHDWKSAVEAAREYLDSLNDPAEQQPTREECLLKWMVVVTDQLIDNTQTEPERKIALDHAFVAYRKTIGKE